MKKTNKKAFTLAELLVVVAIIAVLAAVSIPVFTSQLDKAKLATDLANVRAKYAELVSQEIVNGSSSITISASTLASAATNGSSVKQSGSTCVVTYNGKTESFPIDSHVTISN